MPWPRAPILREEMGSVSLTRSKPACRGIVTSAATGREGAGTEGYTAPVPPLVTSASRWGSHLGKGHVKQQHLTHVPPCVAGAVPECPREEVIRPRVAHGRCRVMEMEEGEEGSNF